MEGLGLDLRAGWLESWIAGTRTLMACIWLVNCACLLYVKLSWESCNANQCAVPAGKVRPQLDSNRLQPTPPDFETKSKSKSKSKSELEPSRIQFSNSFLIAKPTSGFWRRRVHWLLCIRNELMSLRKKMLPVGTAGADSPVAEDESSRPFFSFLILCFSGLFFFLRAGLVLIWITVHQTQDWLPFHYLRV